MERTNMPGGVCAIPMGESRVPNERTLIRDVAADFCLCSRQRFAERELVDKGLGVNHLRLLLGTSMSACTPG